MFRFKTKRHLLSSEDSDLVLTSIHTFEEDEKNFQGRVVSENKFSIRLYVGKILSAI